MPTQLIAGDNQNEASIIGSNDGAIKFRIGPAGSKADGLSISSIGDVAALGKLTQKGGAPVPRMLLLPAKATTSGTAIDFSPSDGTGIPSWAKKVTVNLRRVSTAGVSLLLLQVGTASGVVVTGYAGAVLAAQGTNNSTTGANSTGIKLNESAGVATDSYSGSITLVLDGLNWVATGTLAGNTSARTMSTVADGTVVSALDRVRLTTVNGTDVFDAGSINILVEGYE